MILETNMLFWLTHAVVALVTIGVGLVIAGLKTKEEVKLEEKRKDYEPAFIHPIYHDGEFYGDYYK